MDLSRVTWRKSSYSGGNGGNCVEVAALPDSCRAVRDSKDPDGPALIFSATEWRVFTTAVRDSGEFDLGYMSGGASRAARAC